MQSVVSLVVLLPCLYSSHDEINIEVSKEAMMRAKFRDDEDDEDIQFAVRQTLRKLLFSKKSQMDRTGTKRQTVSPRRLSLCASGS